ncbi:MAG: GNAT family N-acetyltransferase, partial [Planctomycetes bacterium]|nr:GNAT family N-acetyltransferase [Planctomycetota bacterium]
MLRPVTPGDTPALLLLTDGTGVFKPIEIETLRGVLDDYHATNHEEGHRAFLVEEAGKILGYVYYAPEEMTDRTWCVWWIAVD